MSTFTLKQVGDFVRNGKAPKLLLITLKQVKRIFTFTQERSNRYKRYIKIVQAYERGKPVAEIESEFGCCRQTVLRYARLAELPKRPKSFDPNKRKATITMYKAGVPISQIQARLGVSQAYVSKVATEEGINRYGKRK